MSSWGLLFIDNFGWIAFRLQSEGRSENQTQSAKLLVPQTVKEPFSFAMLLSCEEVLQNVVEGKSSDSMYLTDQK